MNGVKTKNDYMEAKRQIELMRGYLANLQNGTPSVLFPSRCSEPKWRVIYISGAQERLNDLTEQVQSYEAQQNDD